MGAEMNEKNLEAIQRKLYDIEFTSVYVLDIETKNLIVVKNLVEELPGRNGEVFPYRKHIDVLLRDFLVQDDEEDAANDFILENILLSLKKEEKVIFSHSMIYGGRLHRFRWDYCYKDETKKELIIVRIDITEFFMRSYRLQTDLTEQLMKEKAASIAKSEFLSTMSHDIRTPLNAILNMLQLTRDDFLGIGEGDVLEDLDKIDIASTFLLGLLNDVLDMSSIENGQMELLPDVYEFAEFVSYIDCIFETLCHEKKISFICDYGKTDFAIYVDKIRFNQIFFNVLSNAVKYTPEGGSISFRLYDNEVIKNKLYWKMEISDTGCGMSEEFQQKMFLPFEREKKTEHAYEGAGLGLPIVKKIVDLMGGTLDVSSKEGLGTTVTISLHATIATDAQIEEYRERVGEKLEGVPLAGKTVLIVEDNEMNMMVLTRMLRREQMLIREAWNGKEALEMFEASAVDSIDLILMDIRMPIMNGYDATRAIRSMDRSDAKRIPILALTADGFIEDRTLSREAGMDDHLCKPVNAKQLCGTIQKHLKKIER